MVLIIEQAISTLIAFGGVIMFVIIVFFGRFLLFLVQMRVFIGRGLRSVRCFIGRIIVAIIRAVVLGRTFVTVIRFIIVIGQW